jgi:hypothetical protein
VATIAAPPSADDAEEAAGLLRASERVRIRGGGTRSLGP